MAGIALCRVCALFQATDGTVRHSEPARVPEVSAEREQANGCDHPTEAKTADECNRDLLSSLLARHRISPTHGVP
jgi:hypothetical protein